MKEWYLATPNPNVCSGYESDVITDYAQSNFTDVLYTTFADTVTLYNYDLSEFKNIQCIIQGNSADTQLKSMERIGLFPIGTVKAGMYILFEDNYWIIDGYPSNNKSYEKATMKLCQYKLRWQNTNGEIIERYVNLTSASKYDVGETSNNTIVLSNNNFTVLIPNDEESLGLDGKRVFIDLHPTNPTRVFKITRTDDALFNYNQQGGILSLIADKAELDVDTDNKELRICDYIKSSSPTPPSPSEPNETTDLWKMTLSHTASNIIRIGGSKKTVMAQLVDENGNNVDECTYEWKIASDYMDYIKYDISENKMRLWVDDALTQNCTVTVTVSSKYTGQEATKEFLVRLGV